ncbi:hypothetical protein [Butyricimonas virosa]|uniref:hypothetical protein n=1 Tax=Butyricimonas virosa TaxID=544645 RepID=UPI0022DF8228|nr:hypothetical protein [Butyricimonas virosa]
MKKLLLSFGLLMLLPALSVQAQKKQVYNDFSRWSLGLNGGNLRFSWRHGIFLR